MVLSMRLLDWEPSTLTTRPLKLTQYAPPLSARGNFRKGGLDRASEEISGKEGGDIFMGGCNSKKRIICHNLEFKLGNFT